MAKTETRRYCESCNKRNLCSFYGSDGLLKTICKTDSCLFNKQERNIPMNNNYIDSIDLTFHYPATSYRGISSETCKFLGIQIAEVGDKQIIRYTHTNLDSSQSIKERYPNKVFKWDGKTEQTNMFGLDKCNDFNSPLIITEGNEDAATIWDLGYQACSVLSATTEIKDIELAYDRLEKYPEIWICIEQDKAGRTVTENIKRLLAHKLIRQIDLSPRKDANDWIRENPDREELLNRLNNGIEILPEGIIFGNQLDINRLKTTNIRSIPLPWPKLNDSLNGLEYGCLYLFLAGTSVGKSSILRELGYYYRTELPDLKIANFFLEENEEVTPLAYVSIHNNVPLGNLRRDRTLLSSSQWDYAHQELLNTENLLFINKDFKKESESILKHIEYLVRVKKFDMIIIDHISYIIGRTGVSKHGERRDVDEFIYKLQDLVQRLNCIILAVSHVNESSSQKRWDQGEIPNIYSGRSSKVLAQVPDGIIGLSRNMVDASDILSLYNLKNRWFSKLGKMDDLVYINETGRLKL